MKCRLVPEDALGVDLGYGVDGGEAEVLAAVLLEVGTHAVEVSPTLPNGFERAQVALQQEEDAGQGIEPAAAPHHALQLALRKVLVEQQEIVAEVEVRLAGILLGQRASTYVIDNAFGHAHDAAATSSQSPT